MVPTIVSELDTVGVAAAGAGRAAELAAALGDGSFTRFCVSDDAAGATTGWDSDTAGNAVAVGFTGGSLIPLSHRPL